MSDTKIDFSTVDEILEFWFQTHAKKHYVKDADFDALIGTTFKSQMQAIRSGDLDFWQSDPKACLAGLVLLDQFSRNLYRDTPAAFSEDERARTFAKIGIARGFDLRFKSGERTLFYMPLMHSEYLDDQFMCEAAFKRATEEGDAGGWEYATKHRVIIEKFGRFPHRNTILDRRSTPEEVAFLTQPGSSF